MRRLKITVRGAVQGVGFRPFVYRLATDLGLMGWVRNSAQGVFIEAEGSATVLENFVLRLEQEKPPRSSIQSLEATWLDLVGYRTFEVLESDATGPKTVLVLPDIATCGDCRREIFDPTNRRFFYPFTNCTNCGPRFSIIEQLPYDRANTSMKGFQMCSLCQAEYDNPLDRRFHAQPNACPVCGPHLELWDAAGNILMNAALGNAPAAQRTAVILRQTADAIKTGKIIALKGLGGFHLIVSARDQEAVRRLREQKHREEKPFAVMFPSLDSVKAHCDVSAPEERLLLSPEAPVTLLRRKKAGAAIEPTLPDVIAPGNPYLGAMLPYTPLHQLLMSLVDFPVIATSGNLSDEPICIDEREALDRLRGIADLFLVHNRPIVRHVDDSIARIIVGREMIVRRARGYAPLPLQLPRTEPEPQAILAVGAHLKNSIALSVGGQIFISQHIGDLETEAAFGAFTRVITDFQKLYETTPRTIAADAHPEYLSTKFARESASGSTLADGHTQKDLGAPVLVSVQHHLAHVYSCMIENELEPPLLGVSWDGTGYGLDGTIWGGEFFLVTQFQADRIAHWRPFRLPGGEQAIKEPRRTALGLLFELMGEAAFEHKKLACTNSFSTAELSLLRSMLLRGLNSPLTSSVGRLFDAAASLCNLHQKVRFEGQAAMALEFATENLESEEGYPVALREFEFAKSDELGFGSTRPKWILDWGPLVQALLHDLDSHEQIGRVSVKFHNALVGSIIQVAEKAGTQRVVLTGGCFQNKYLLEKSIERLENRGFRPYWHQRVPPNDGGIALGQVLGAIRNLNAQKVSAGAGDAPGYIAPPGV